MSIQTVDQDLLVKKTAEQLKEVIKKPEWASFVKTGMHKERAPIDPDWWYMRAASVLKRIALKGPVGVSKLRNVYGGRKNRGHKPERFYKGSGSIARKLLQQLEKAELVVKGNKGVHKGRIITPKGQSLLDKTALSIHKAKGK